MLYSSFMRVNRFIFFKKIVRAFQRKKNIGVKKYTESLLTTVFLGLRINMKIKMLNINISTWNSLE